MSIQTIVLMLAVSAVFLQSCFPAQLETQPTVTSASSRVTLSAPTPTNTPSLNTLTTTPSVMPSIQESPFPPGPTLTVDESKNEIDRMMQGDPECLFPCWWGVVPGKTSHVYAVAVLSHLNLKWSFFDLPEGREYGGPFVASGDFVSASIGFTVLDKIVEEIHIHGSNGSDLVFANRWEYYTLTEILKTYGIPSRLWVIYVEGGEVGSARNSYHLLVFYDEKKVFIKYSGASASNTICPDFKHGEVNVIDIYLQNPDNSRKLTDITNVARTIDLLDQQDVHRVEKMTESKIRDLNTVITEHNEIGCIEINTN